MEKENELLTMRDVYWARAQEYYKKHGYFDPRIFFIGTDLDDNNKVVLADVEYPKNIDSNHQDQIMKTISDNVKEKIKIWGIGFASAAYMRRIPKESLETGSVSEIVDRFTHSCFEEFEVIMFQFETSEETISDVKEAVKSDVLEVNEEGDLVPSVELVDFDTSDGSWEGPLTNLFQRYCQ